MFQSLGMSSKTIQHMNKEPFDFRPFIKVVNSLIALILLLVSLIAWALITGPSKIQALLLTKENIPNKLISTRLTSDFWIAPDTSQIPAGTNGDEIRYGRDLIANTSAYLGPDGKVMAISNGMNCQNCHLDAGTKPFGNNYSAVASTYPKFRARSGTSETIEKRVNDCIERSLNGHALPEESREMKAMVAYIKWIGKEVPKGVSPKGVGLVDLAFMEEAANPAKGKILYDVKCIVCHGKRGEGIMNADSATWIYPPLWGKASYNEGAGLYRLSRFAGYIKANMPLGATFLEPQLTDEEAWHIAAYVNSMNRPSKDLSKDWPDIAKKPIDHPFGPYTDGFDERQHKYGPFKSIIARRKELDLHK
jgi:thiosulfate dehydrogenase